jgi:predicted nucleic acid-binding protein
MSTTITSIDSNVLIYLLNQDDRLNKPALAAVAKARSLGKLLICGPVYSELMGLPERTQEALDEFFTVGGIRVDWQFEENIWRTAGTAFQGYVERRTADSLTFPRRILADFLIGAHAVIRGYSLLTVDKRMFRTSFPGIRVQSI